MIKKEDPYFRYFLISVAFHAVILIFLTVRILFFPDEIQEYKKSIRVDVVALPEKQIEKKVIPPTKKNTPPKETPKKVEEKPEEVVKKPKPKLKPPQPKKKKVSLKKKPDVKKVKDEQNSAIARLKALQKIKDKKKEEKKVEFKGNEVSKGNSLTGLSKLHHESYLDELDGHIRNFWNLPEWLADGKLKARVLLLINKNGGINGKSFVMKSGNDLFDQHVMGTLEKASPLPVPPSNLIDFYATKGVEIRFPE